MSDEVRPRKQPITGRSAKDRAFDRADSATKVEAAAKKRSAAMETRVHIAVGAKAISLASDYPIVRRLIASAAAEHKGTGLGDVLNVKAAGAHAIDVEQGFEDAWARWERLRNLNNEIERTWVTLELTLPQDGPDAQRRFDDLSDQLRTLAAEWEALVGAEHPVQRLARLTE